MIKYLLKKKITQLKKEYDSSTEEDVLSESETSDEEDSANEKNEIDIDPCDVIESSQRSFCPPYLETDVDVKWYAVIWLGKRTKKFVHWKGFASVPGYQRWNS